MKNLYLRLCIYYNYLRNSSFQGFLNYPRKILPHPAGKNGPDCFGGTEEKRQVYCVLHDVREVDYCAATYPGVF